MLNNVDDIINKSLEEIDALVEEVSKAKENDADISKAVGDENLAPEDVSEDTPAEEDDEQDDEGQEEPTGDDSDVDSDAEPEEDTDSDEEVEKSLEEELKSDEGVRKALEVSEFLSALVKGLSDDLAAHNERLTKSVQSTDQATQLLAKSFEGIAKSQKVVMETQVELLKSVKALSKRMQRIESQPQVRKSVASAAKPLEKSFINSAGDVASTNATKLSKSDISAKLFQGVTEGKVAQEDLLAFDSLGVIAALSPSAQSYLGLK